MKPINPRGNLSPEDCLYLYWFAQIKDDIKIKYEDFLPSESLINSYNDYLQKWIEDFRADPVRYQKTVDWDVSRKKTDYFREKLQAGHAFEVWVGREFQKYGVDLGSYLDEKGQYSGENAFGIEIKHDMKLSNTGNLYIEYQERLRNELPWTDSGILKDDNTKYWIIGGKEEYYIFYKQTLRSLYDQLRNGKRIYGCRFADELANGTSKGFLMNRKKAKELCLATSIEKFLRQRDQTYYATGYYYHGRRDCKYIANKKEEDLQIFSSAEEASTAGYHKCTDKNCFS